MMQSRIIIFIIVSGGLIIFGSFDQVFGQQDPQYTQYMFNTHVFNPAYAGKKTDYICGTFFYQNQWTGFRDARAPGTLTFDASVPLNRKYIKGAGLVFRNDAQGFENTLSLSATGSYDRDFSFGNLTFGLNLGIIRKSLEADFVITNQGDPFFSQEKISNTLPDVGLGVLFQRKNLYVGLSALHLTKPDKGWGDNSTYRRHYYLTGGYKYAINENIDIQPNFLLKSDFVNLQYDITALGYYQKKYWGGLSYRGGDALSLLIGLNVLDNFDFGYSYGLPISGNDVKIGGTHELMVRYCFKFIGEN